MESGSDWWFLNLGGMVRGTSVFSSLVAVCFGSSRILDLSRDTTLHAVVSPT